MAHDALPDRAAPRHGRARHQPSGAAGWLPGTPETTEPAADASVVIEASDLLRTKPDRVPRISAGARARTVVLSYCDGQRSARQIEELVLRDHPDLFPV